MTVRVGDLFCGAGGFSTGVSELDWNVLWGVDSNPSAVEVWNENHSGVGVCGDVTEEEMKNVVVNELPEIDVLVGGPPCKDFSKSNRVIDKGRNNLVLVFMKYVELLQPTAFIIENVRELETNYTEVLDEVYSMGEENGFTVSHRTLYAADYGVPQRRVRTFIIGINEFDGEIQFPCPSHGEESPNDVEYATPGEVLEQVSAPDDTTSLTVTSKYADELPEVPPGLNYSYYTERLGHPEPKFKWRSRFSDFLYKANPDRPVRTIKANPGASNGPFHWDNRRFSVREKSALQSFPSDFVWPSARTIAQELIGNAVPPKLARAVADAVNKQAFGEELQYVPCLLDVDAELNIISRRRTSTETYKELAEEQITKLYNEFDTNSD